METAADQYDVYSVIDDFAERERVSRLDARMHELQDATRKMEAYRRISQQEGIPEKTLQRLYTKWRKVEQEHPGQGPLALADKRKLSKATPGSRFYQDFKTYAENDLNSDQGGYDAMLRDFHSGKVFSFGTWRDVYREENPGLPIPERCPIDYVPTGFTYQRMMQLRRKDPTRKISTAWNRRGQFAASDYTVPVLRSRVGLPVGSVYQSDDVWHNIDVFAPGQQGTFQPMEFAFYDVASAFKAVSCMKPRTLVVDPKTGKEKYDNLKEIQYRFSVQYLLGVKGFHKDGVTLIGERGTSRLTDTVLRRVEAVPVFGKLFHWQTSGVLNEAAHKGLLMGNAGGNPRMKSLCECAHNVIHNATASLLGNRGRDAAHMHESRDSVASYSTEMIQLASRIDPTLVPMLQLPILKFEDYCRYFYMMEDAVMDRTRHNLEGWANREVIEYRLRADSDTWLPVSNLVDMAPDEAAATIAVLSKDPKNLYRNRKMSRREVWQQGQRDLIRWPVMDLPAFADPRDAKEITVGSGGIIQFTDLVYYPGVKKTYLAEYVDRKGLHHRLSPGSKVRFYWNPLGELANHIWIADEADNILGIAPILKTAAWADEHSIKVAMGQKLRQVADLMGDTRARHTDDAVRLMTSQKINRFLIDSAKKVANVPSIGRGEAVDPTQLLDVTVPDALPEPVPEPQPDMIDVLA